MLLLGGKSFEVDGITVGVDHADPNLWWHGPGPVALARRPDGQAAFTFIKYKPAAVQGGGRHFADHLMVERERPGSLKEAWIRHLFANRSL